MPMPAEPPNPGFAARRLPDKPDTIAPDGSEVRLLPTVNGGSAGHFRLEPDAASRAGRRRTVDEIWYILEGRGEMWCRGSVREQVIPLAPGLCLTIPVGTSFQFWAAGDTALSMFAVTMSPWPGGSDDEWVEVAPCWPVPA